MFERSQVLRRLAIERDLSADAAVGCYVSFNSYPDHPPRAARGSTKIPCSNARGPGTEKMHIPSHFIMKSSQYCQMPRGSGKNWQSNAQGPGTILCANTRGCPGGMVRAGIERDINDHVLRYTKYTTIVRLTHKLMYELFLFVVID